MKNLLKSNTKIIGATALAVAITISMSFKPQEEVTTQAKESSSFAVQTFTANNTQDAKKFFGRIGAVTEAANLAIGFYNMFGGGNISKEAQTHESLIKVEQSKISRFD